MKEQDNSVSENKLAALKNELCEELEEELRNTHKTNTQAPEKTPNRLYYKTNIDIFLISLGLILFVSCLFLPAYKYLNGYEALNSMYGFFLSNRISHPLNIAFLGNLLVFLCPFFLFTKQPMVLGALALISWIFCVNATVVYFYWEEQALSANYIWFFANVLIACGYVIRTIKQCYIGINSILPQVLSIVSIAFLVPGISLPVLSLEGAVHKAKIFEASRSMILDAVANKANQDPTPINQDFVNTGSEKAKAEAGKMFDELLGMYGFTGESVQGTMRVHTQEISILNTVNQLYIANHGFVALLLVFFFVVIPLTKANLVLGYSITQKPLLQAISGFISKWSMADVFAIAVLLFCLAANSYQFEGLVQMDAKFGIGFYYFVGYCLVSIASSQIDLKKLGAYLERSKAVIPIGQYLENSGGLVQSTNKSKNLFFALYALVLISGGYMAYDSLNDKKIEALGSRCLSMTDPEKVPFEKIDSNPAINACQQSLAAIPDSAKYHALLGRAFYAGHNYPKALSLFKIGAEKGDPIAQNDLGRMYESGDGTPKDDAEAVKWFRKAAEQGYAMAQNNLGGMYQIGKGVNTDPMEAMTWYRKAAEQGDAFGQNQLGTMYDSAYGYDLVKNDEEAVKWFKMAAAQGDPVGQLNLGRKYEMGEGVTKSHEDAVKWYTKSAEQANSGAESALGIMYYNGTGVSKDLTEAVKLFRKSSEHGNSIGQLWLGFMYAKGEGVLKSDTDAVAWYRKAAEQENAVAQFRLGFMYIKGEGVSKDQAEAAKWFRQSAEQGNANAQYNLAEMYVSGNGVSQDYTEAFNWFGKAAQQGHAAAQGGLGMMYCNGFGVPKNEAEGSEWYRKAGISGDTKSQINLGWMYFDGKGGLRQDPIDAVIWFRKAAEQGDPQGQYLMGIMSEKGLGIDKSEDAALDWYRKAAENGHDEAKAAFERLSKF